MSAMPAISALTVNGRPITTDTESDPFIHALARYVEALHRRYPGGPAELRREILDRRANMPRMSNPSKDPAA